MIHTSNRISSIVYVIYKLYVLSSIDNDTNITLSFFCVLRRQRGAQEHVDWAPPVLSESVFKRKCNYVSEIMSAIENYDTPYIFRS